MHGTFGIIILPIFVWINVVVNVFITNSLHFKITESDFTIRKFKTFSNYELNATAAVLLS